MELSHIIEKVDYLDRKENELKDVIEETNVYLDNLISENSSIAEQSIYLQGLLNMVVDIRRTVNSLNQKVPDVQEDIRLMLGQLEDKATLEG